MFPRYGFVRPVHAEQAIGPARGVPGVSHLAKFRALLGCVAADRVMVLMTLLGSAHQLAARTRNLSLA